MNKFINFLKESNHWKHLVGGLTIGLASFNFYTGLYATLVGATCLELKDRLYGNKYDWTDWALTLVGGLLGSLLWLFK